MSMARTLHSLGAAIILLTLPLDLFFQQIVAYPTVWVQTPYEAPIARSTFFDPPGIVGYFNGSRGLYPDPSIFTAGQSYFVRNPVETLYNPGCPTSNCTWEPFDTLALCSACTDVQQKLEFGCQTANSDWFADTANILGPTPNVTQCGWFFKPLGGLPQLMTGYWLNGREPQDALITRFLSLTDTITHENLVPQGSINFKNISNPLSSFILAAVPTGVEGAYRNDTPRAQECNLHWCVKTIQAEYSLGNFSEKVIKETLLDTNNAEEPWVVTGQTPTGQATQSYYPQFNLTVPDKFNTSGNTLYGMTNLTARAIWTGFQQLIPSNWYSLKGDPTIWMKQYYSGDTPLNFDGQVNAWGTSNDIPGLVASLAKSITNAMRTFRNVGTTNIATIGGTAWKQETHVNLRWEWMTLPLALLIFSLVFLITTVIQSSKESNKIGIWKTSALAVLFNGLGDEIQDTIGPKVRLTDARNRAKKLSVQLDD